MPVRSLNSSVLKWPSAPEIIASARRWSKQEALRHPELQALGYFGSYATGRHGVGSDLDLIAIVTHSDQPFERRALSWQLLDLLVQAEILVYTAMEWQRLIAEGSRFAREIERDVQWLWRRDG